MIKFIECKAVYSCPIVKGLKIENPTKDPIYQDTQMKMGKYFCKYLEQKKEKHGECEIIEQLEVQMQKKKEAQISLLKMLYLK